MALSSGIGILAVEQYGAGTFGTQAPVIPIEEALRETFVAERGSITDAESDSGTMFKMSGSPFETGEDMPRPFRAAARPGHRRIARGSGTYAHRPRPITSDGHRGLR
jgi:hypothetical protein